jgi:hypothetical protein
MTVQVLSIYPIASKTYDKPSNKKEMRKKQVKSDMSEEVGSRSSKNPRRLSSEEVPER